MRVIIYFYNNNNNYIMGDKFPLNENWLEFGQNAHENIPKFHSSAFDFTNLLVSSSLSLSLLFLLLSFNC